MVARTTDRVLLVGAGVGATPVRAILDDLPAHVDVTVILRASTRSELVLPVVRAGAVLAVLDLDSPHLDAFSPDEADRLATLVADVFAEASF